MLDPGQQEILKQVYVSSLKASYFSTMAANKFSEKSRIQLEKSTISEIVDENTFRVNRSFQRPQNQALLWQKIGQVSLEGSSKFFSCFGKKQYEARLSGFIFKVFLGNKIKYYFNFDVINVEVKNEQGLFSLKIKTLDKTFTFCTKVKSQSSQWAAIIKAVIEGSSGKSNFSEYICRIPEFYTKPYIGYKQFEKQANTGDVILFRSQHSAARLQHLFLNSQYDHVALVLRNKKNQLFFYQSSSFEGVGFTQWRHLVDYEFYKQAEKIAWKKLNFKFQKNHFDIIEAFIAKTLGKQFQINLQKIFAFESKITRNKNEEEQKTYFCSELVARMYKQLGLLDPTVSCTQYYPVTFSDKGSLKFIDPKASLSDQYLIAFR